MHAKDAIGTEKNVTL